MGVGGRGARAVPWSRGARQSGMGMPGWMVPQVRVCRLRTSRAAEVEVASTSGGPDLVPRERRHTRRRHCPANVSLQKGVRPWAVVGALRGVTRRGGASARYAARGARAAGAPQAAREKHGRCAAHLSTAPAFAAHVASTTAS